MFHAYTFLYTKCVMHCTFGLEIFCHACVAYYIEAYTIIHIHLVNLDCNSVHGEHSASLHIYFLRLYSLVIFLSHN